MKNLIVLWIACAGIAWAQVPIIGTTATALQEGQTATVSCTANCTSLVWKVNGVVGGNSSVGTIAGSGTVETYTAPASTVANNELLGCQVGFNDHVWNTPAAGLPVIANWRGDPFLNDAWYHFYETLQDVPNNGRTWIGTNLLVNSNIGMSYADASTPLLNFSGNGAVFHNIPWPAWPAHYKEGGTFDYDGNIDHHTLVMRTDTCDFSEVFGEQLHTGACPSGGGTCFDQTSGMGTSTHNTYLWNGGTDAGGGMLTPYTLHLSEVKAGVIKHLLHGRIPGLVNSSTHNLMWPATFGAGSCNAQDIVGLTIVNGGTGYDANTVLTFSGGGQAAPVDTFQVNITGGVITGLVMTHSAFSTIWHGFTSAPTVTVTDPGGPGTGAVITATVDYPCIPMGARFVLKSSYLTAHAGGSCSAGSNCLTNAGLTVATALNVYGMLDLDNNGTELFSVDASPDLLEDGTIYNQIHGQIPTIPFSAFSIVDQSKLAISTASGVNNQTGCFNSPDVIPCPNGKVVPDNDLGINVPGGVWITATNSSGPSLSASIGLVAPTIGTYDEEIYVRAGDYSGSRGTGGGIQLPYWVNGTASTAVTWACATCAGNGTSITSGGIYVPPATLTTTGSQDIAIGTLTADTNVKKTIWINLLPNSGNYEAGVIRADIANASDFGPDGNSHYWQGNIGGKIGDIVPSNTALKYYTGTGESTVYATAYYSSSNDDHHYKFYVPNANYKVRILSGWIDNQNISVTSWNHMPGIAVVTDRGVGVVKKLHWNIMENAGLTYASSSNSDILFGATVTNNVLEIDNASDWPSPSGWPSCASHGGTCQSWPSTSGLDIEADATAPHWEIARTNGVPASNVATFVSNKLTVAPGGTITLYLRDWYTGLNDPVWTLVSGPGTITQTTTSISAGETIPIVQYKAPASGTFANQGVVIQAQSLSSPTTKASITLQISGPTGPAVGPVFLK